LSAWNLEINASFSDAASCLIDREALRFDVLARPSLDVSMLPRILILICLSGLATVARAGESKSPPLAQTPPMGWNDWAHYRCGFSAQTVLANARALVKTALATRGYNTVTVDDCWMQKTRDAAGNLQFDPQRFPDGIRPVADAIHKLGLKFGIYEDAGYETCGGYAGSGESDGGGHDHFLQDARLFASWGVDYLKLDGCNLYVPKGSSKVAAYRKAYAAERAALNSVGRPIVFSESAPAYFLDTPDWYDVLHWVSEYGELWREGWDIVTFKPERPMTSRFHSVLWNYSYNLPLGRFQMRGHWNDPDFIIGGDQGMTLPETRTQMALWSMMSAPLILSSDIDRLSSESLAVLENEAVIAVDQDALGRMATLVRRSSVMDILFKPLSNGEYAVAVMNRGPIPLSVGISAADLGFSTERDCHIIATNLWNGTRSKESSLLTTIASHDTEIWRIHPGSNCGTPLRTGAVTMILNSSKHDIDSYSRCLSAKGEVGRCSGAQDEMWTVSHDGLLKSSTRCLASTDSGPALQPCTGAGAQHWRYTLSGNLISAASKECLSTAVVNGEPTSLTVSVCGHDQPNQVWSLPN
jgi:alpha-galactosidase